MKKGVFLLDRLGTFSIIGLGSVLLKVGLSVACLYATGILNSLQQYVLLLVSVLATESSHVTEILRTKQIPQRVISFVQGESLVVNILMIILSYTLHPFTANSYMAGHSIFYRLFANIFFSLLIGMAWAFLASYSLKRSYGKLLKQTEIIDNYDMLMMILSPIVSFLMAETFAISGLLSLMCCAFFQSVYASKNLDHERALLFSNMSSALSSTFRSLSEVLVGVSLALHYQTIKAIGYGMLVILPLIILSLSISYWGLKKAKLDLTDTERFALFI